MHQQYKTFLDWFLSVAFYSCDQTEDTPPPVYDDEYPPVSLRRIEITSEEFYQELYEYRDTIKVIKYHSDRRRNLICLVGPRGSGKSTIAQKFVREIEEERQTNKGAGSFVVFIDIKIEADTNTIDLTDPTTIEKTLRARLQAEYREKLFKLTREGENPRIKLWAFLLDSERQDLKPMPIFSVFQHLQDEATLMLRKYDNTHAKVSVEEWLEAKLDEEEVHNLVTKVDKLIDFHHLAYAAQSVLNIRQQTIWFDNLDRFDEKEQTQAMMAVRRLLHPVNKRVNMGVSIREENVFRDHELWDDGANPYETRVMLQMPEEHGRHVYPSADVPVAKEAELRNIIKKRLLFTKNYQTNSVRKLSKRIADLEADDTRDEIEILMLKRELEKLGPVITEERFGIVQTLSDKLLNAMFTEKAIYLANNSLRDFMFIFRDCLADLFDTPEKAQSKNDDVPALKYEDWYISTLFLRRARHAQRRYKLGVYDVLANAEEWFNQGKTGIGCLLPHIIITTIWNLVLRGKNNNIYRRTPNVGDVVSRLEVIGYDRNIVVESMYAIYSHYHGRQSLIEFRDRSIIASADSITDKTPVYLTYRGKCLAGRTSGSFGYLYDCLQLLCDGGTVNTTFIDHPDIRSTDEIATNLLPYLCDVAQMHYHTLKEIQVRNAFKSWPHSYYKDFSVPYDKEYSRLHPYQPMLQLEIILRSLLGYVRHSEAANKIGQLLNAFKEAVNALSIINASDSGSGSGQKSGQAEVPNNANNIASEPDFRKILNLEPR